jgi:hypothetical protein
MEQFNKELGQELSKGLFLHSKQQVDEFINERNERMSKINSYFKNNYESVIDKYFQNSDYKICLYMDDIYLE